jgi:hypothetical protein
VITAPSGYSRESVEEQRGNSVGPDDRGFFLRAAAAVVLVVGLALLLLRVFGLLGSSNGIAAALTFLGVLISASVSFLGLVIKRQAEDRMDREQLENDERLRLDAAMRAGALFNEDGHAGAPAAAASGLLALTELNRADLAVALLVDLWDAGRERVDADAQAAGEVSDNQTTSGSRPVGSLQVSNEVAVLVIDAALQSGKPNAELVAAELLCRNARRLDVRQSLHWPSAVDGRWNPSFGNKTKLLLVDALVRMALTSASDQSALQSLAVRLFGISEGDADGNVKGCLGVLITAILPQLRSAGTLMQGPSEVTFGDLERAANYAKPNPNRHMARVVKHRAEQLEKWAAKCQGVNYLPGALAATTGL